jgi:hypothetical protein
LRDADAARRGMHALESDALRLPGGARQQQNLSSS